MKKFLKMLMSASIVSCCVFALSGVSATRLDRFYTKFMDLAKTCEYDKDFVEEMDEKQRGMIGPNIEHHIAASCDRIDRHKKGVCRTFAFALYDFFRKETEVQSFIIFNDGKKHCANMYYDQDQKRFLVADLTYAIGGQKEEAIRLFSRIPLDAYIEVSFGNDFKGTSVGFVSSEGGFPILIRVPLDKFADQFKH